MAYVEVLPLPVRQIVKCFVLRGDDGTVLVDSGPLGKQLVILRAMAEEGVEPEEVDLILLTHCHHDHVWGLQELQERTGAQVAAHRLAAEYIRDGRQPQLQSTGLLGRILKLFLPGPDRTRTPAVEPDIVIDDRYDLREFGVAADVIRTPGHTPGSLSVITNGKEAIVGDLVMGLPNPSSPRLPLWADDLEQVKASIRDVLSHAPRVIHPAHGGPFDPGQVRRLVE